MTRKHLVAAHAFTLDHVITPFERVMMEEALAATVKRHVMVRHSDGSSTYNRDALKKLGPIKTRATPLGDGMIRNEMTREIEVEG